MTKLREFLDLEDLKNSLFTIIMQRKRISLNELEPAWGYDHHSPDLVKRVQERGWEGIAPIPVIEIPEKLRIDGKRYSYCDGHHRHNAAIITGADSLDCILYDERDDIEEVEKQTGGGGVNGL